MIESLCKIWASIVATLLSGCGIDTHASGNCFYWADGGLRVIGGCLAPRGMFLVAMVGMAWFWYKRRWFCMLLAPGAAAAGSIARLLIIALIYRASWSAGEWLHSVGTWPAILFGFIILFILNRIPRKINWRIFLHERS